MSQKAGVDLQGYIATAKKSFVPRSKVTDSQPWDCSICVFHNLEIKKADGDLICLRRRVTAVHATMSLTDVGLYTKPFIKEKCLISLSKTFPSNTNNKYNIFHPISQKEACNHS